MGSAPSNAASYHEPNCPGKGHAAAFDAANDQLVASSTESVTAAAAFAVEPLPGSGVSAVAAVAQTSVNANAAGNHARAANDSCTCGAPSVATPDSTPRFG